MSGWFWYNKGICGQKSCTVEIDLNRLGLQECVAEIFADGVNADRHAEDYRRTVSPVSGVLRIKMAAGGGFALRLTRP